MREKKRGEFREAVRGHNKMPEEDNSRLRSRSGNSADG